MTLITRYRNLAVKRKLQVIIMATVFVALLASCGAILTYIQFELRDDSQHDLTTLAVVYGANATAALTFGDHQAAAELLASLATQREIVSALNRRPAPPLTPLSSQRHSEFDNPANPI